MASKLRFWALTPLVHRVAALLPPTFTSTTIILGQIPPTGTVRHGFSLAVCLGVGFKLLVYDSRGQLSAGTASLDTV